ncbi:LytR C-terminal domain-containing protein [Blastococcus montanus]|uniref:LytR C-terminal domain-containing protein n=1 Tax=Blastococcus montanus TaxID=3144973 RepID=UPI00320A734C
MLLDVPAADSPRQVPRSRLPLPPVPAGSRPVATPAPRTSVAPFQAVPAPESRIEVAAPARAVDVLAPVAAGAWLDDEPLDTTGPGQGVAGRTVAPRVPLAPRVPRQTTPAGAPSSSYGDWTKPSRTGDTGRSRLDLDALPDVVPAAIAPATTAIPERGAAARADDDVDAEAMSGEAPAVVAGPGTGPVKGGRAAYRAERQAADAVRRKAAKRSGEPDVLFDDEPEPKPRRVLHSLVAMAVVALVVLGVYTVTGRESQEAAARTPVATTTAPATPPVATLPPLTSEPVVVEPAVTTPVRVPVTVLNATTVNGLAGKIAGVVVAAGWESPGVGAYPGTDVATSTVFFTEGDEQQRQAALQLIDQFPDLAGPAPRFFDVADVPAPGLVVVATGNWQP